MYKFMISSLFLAVIFQLATSHLLEASGSSSRSVVRNLQSQLAIKVAKDIVPDPTSAAAAGPVINQALHIVSEIIKSTALNVCPPQQEQTQQRKKRSQSSELGLREILELLMREDNIESAEQESQEQTQEHNNLPSQQQDSEQDAQDINKLVGDLAQAIKDDDERLAGLSDVVVSQLSNVLQSTVEAITAIALESCPSEKNEIHFCMTSVGKASNACKQLRGFCMNTNGAGQDDCATTRVLCHGATGQTFCKRAFCHGNANAAALDICR